MENISFNLSDYNFIIDFDDNTLTAVSARETKEEWVARIQDMYQHDDSVWVTNRSGVYVAFDDDGYTASYKDPERLNSDAAIDEGEALAYAKLKKIQWHIAYRNPDYREVAHRYDCRPFKHMDDVRDIRSGATGYVKYDEADGLCRVCFIRGMKFSEPIDEWVSVNYLTHIN